LARAIDTIDIAKCKIPGARYSLDELCKRFGIDLSARQKHGALLDGATTAPVVIPPRPHPLVPRISEVEAEAHETFVADELGGDAVWNWR
jgi:DNA polymerase-3 subunit epsilon